MTSVVNKKESKQKGSTRAGRNARKRRGGEKKRKERQTLGGSPSRDLSGKLDSNDLGALEFPGKVGDNVDGISSSDSDSDHSESSGVGSVRVGSDHETSRERVVLEDDLSK